MLIVNIFFIGNVFKNEVLFENYEVCVLYWIKGGKFLVNYILI